MMMTSTTRPKRSVYKNDVDTDDHIDFPHDVTRIIDNITDNYGNLAI